MGESSALTGTVRGMTQSLRKTAINNHILSRLSADDLAALRPLLKAVDMPLRRPLQVRNRPIEHVYFIESGFASILLNHGSSRGIEIGLIGCEGMAGLPLAMGVNRTPHDVFMQNAGSGWQLAAGDFQRLIAERRGLLNHVLLYAQMLSLQTDYTAVANARNKIEERLARWLLMAHDRLASDRLAITQEFLAQMLGVRRPGVTVAMNLLERAGVVSSKRGIISLLSRKRLERASNGAYGIPEAEYRRVLG